ncbi:MAG: NAD-dependent epimerase/dehydratase family protein [Thermoflexia bacterium]|nr:MAG: NAD-dependent epimerase/dehydratase family protein [Thermoflexia bacterium]
MASETFPHPLPPAPVLVTGAAGFIGRHLVNRLLSLECPVAVLDLPGAPLPSSWKGRVQVYCGDIADPKTVREAVARARTVFHLAAIVSDWGPEALYRRVTVEGSRNVYDAAAASGARVVLASSIAVFGDRIGCQACDEETPFGNPVGPYSRAKQEQERLAWEYHQKGHLAVTVVRPANVYGPGSRPWVDLVVQTLRDRLPSLIGSGNQNAGLAYVENVVDVLLLAAARPEAVGRVYHACDGENVTWKRYFSDLARLAGTPPPWSIPLPLARLGAALLETLWGTLRLRGRPPLTREAVNLVGSHHRIGTEQTRRELGYEPRVQYSEALRALQTYLQQGVLQ